VGWLGHEGPFYDELTVRENLAFAAQVSHVATDGLDNVIATVGLGSRADLRAKHLSAGQRRRVGLAWLLLRRAELWLLDEPYASLDAEARSLFDDIVAQATVAGSCVVVTSHDELRTDVPVTTLTLRGGSL
jgi:ABC-type transport system involved in cytochrome c biogenesis ATPase subunit